MLQTVPALALLMFMIPLFGIGKGPALVALSLYALLPIARNTYAGLIAIDRTLLEIAWVLRLAAAAASAPDRAAAGRDRSWPGIKTAVVTTVGTATLAAFIGGGGYGSADRARPRARRHRDDPGRRRARGGHGAGFHALFELAWTAC